MRHSYVALYKTRIPRLGHRIRFIIVIDSLFQYSFSLFPLMDNRRLSLLEFGLFAASCQALSNTNYFTFPSKTDDIPLVHLGDTLNVTWLSDYSQAVMYFWCDSGAKKSKFSGFEYLHQV